MHTLTPKIMHTHTSPHYTHHHTHMLSHTYSIEYLTFSPFQENSSPAILLAFADGVIEIHHLNTTSEPNRDQHLLSYLDNLV